MRFRLALALATSVASLASCGHERREIRVVLRDACGLTLDADCQKDRNASETCGGSHCSRNAAWANLVVFEGGCPKGDGFATGDSSGAVRIVTGRAGRALPSIGELEEDRYGFGGVFRTSDCTIVGTGCTEVDLSEERDVRIDVLPVPESGTCESGHYCEQGLCAPFDDPSGDASACIPLLIASGSLPNRTANSTARSLGLVATESGYLVGYREDLESDGELLLRLVPIGKDGKIGKLSESRIEHCASGSDSGLGMALSLDGGLLATALAPCDGQGAGAAFVSFTHDGAILSARRFIGAGSDLVLAPSRALAPGPGRNDFELVYTTGQSAHRLGLTGPQPHGSFQALFPDARGSFAQVATTPDLVARLVGSADGIHLGIGEWEATPKLMTFGGAERTSLAVQGDRVVIARALEDRGLAWEGRTSSGASIGEGNFAASQALTALDVVIANGEVIAATASSPGFFLLSIGNMSRGLSPRPELIVQHTPASSAHDGRSLAAASLHDRLAIAWLNGDPSEESIGGFALFECSR